MDIFTLTDENGNLLHPIRQAATFAKYSRSPESARELVKKTDELSGEKFQEKWIVKFGHNSIAELATLPIAFEDVSIVASKEVEAWQRPGVSEKSTRMQKFNRESLYIPEGIDNDLLKQTLPLMDECFNLYENMLSGNLAEEIKTAYGVNDFNAGRMAFDMARYLLPAGTKTNLGICAYPRDISRMIAELSGSHNQEFQDIGEELKSATTSLGGPLIRHTEPDEWYNKIPKALVVKKPGNGSTFMTWSGRGECDFAHLLQTRYGLTLQDLDKLMQERPEYHEAPKFFREIQLDFSIYMDYGAFRDLQRHRRMEQFVEPLTPNHGFSVPPGLEVSMPVFNQFNTLLEKFCKIKWPKDPKQQELCQYLVPLAFIVGWHIKMDLQELYYLVELRTQEAGHPSYRKIAYDLWDEAAKEYPTLTQWIRPRGPRP